MPLSRRQVHGIFYFPQRLKLLVLLKPLHPLPKYNKKEPIRLNSKTQTNNSMNNRHGNTSPQIGFDDLQFF